MKRRNSKILSEMRRVDVHAGMREADFDPGYSTQLDKVEIISICIFTGYSLIDTVLLTS